MLSEIFVTETHCVLGAEGGRWALIFIIQAHGINSALTCHPFFMIYFDITYLPRLCGVENDSASILDQAISKF